jgi:beta-lactamase regulating signal transducer with metallopeptidase domain
MLCILYVIAIGTLLGVAGLLVERSLPATTTGRRWVWSLVIAITMTVPPVYRANHTSSVGTMLGEQSAESLTQMINHAWLLGSAMLIIWAFATAARVWFLVRQSRGNGNSSSQSIDGVPVVVTDSVGPATVGVLRSRVIVPRWVLALPAVQRRYVLRHEDEHRKSHDALLLFVASLALILTPWNLALWWQLRRLRLAVEMDCDNRVVSALGDANAYGELLFKVAQAASRGPRLQPAFLGQGLLERRLTALVAPAPLQHAQRLLLPTVACVLLFVVFLMPHPVPSPASGEPQQHAHAASSEASGR